MKLLLKHSRELELSTHRWVVLPERREHPCLAFLFHQWEWGCRSAVPDTVLLFEEADR